MTIAVIIPLRAADVCKTYWNTLVSYFTSRSTPVILALNGEGVLDVLEALKESKEQTDPTWDRWLIPINGGPNHNPYAARNKALALAFDGEHLGTVDYCILTDADCTPDENYLPILRQFIQGAPYMLIAGRTKTRIPKTDTPHFNSLRDTQFECYDGFTPPDHTVGANMVIGRAAYEKLGPMRETQVSGGDGIYGIAFKAQGESVTPAYDLVMYKTIEGMTLRGIIEKQFRRACSFPEAMIPEPDQTVRDLNNVLHELVLYADYDLETVIEEYPTVIDLMFKLMMHLGVLTHTLDRVKPNDPNKL